MVTQKRFPFQDIILFIIDKYTLHALTIILFGVKLVVSIKAKIFDKNTGVERYELMKKVRILLVLMVISLCFFLLTACQNGKQFIYSNYDYFGSTLKAVVYTNNDSFNFFTEQADAHLQELNLSCNEEIEGSDIYKFNLAIDGEKIEVQKTLFDVVKEAKEIHTLTNGAYNPCVYYLVDLWGFSTRFSKDKDIVKIYDRAFDESGFLPIPEKKYIDAFSDLSNFDKVLCLEKDGKYYLMKENTKVTVDGQDYYAKIDLGGLIKGYAIDKLTEIANRLGITKGYISYGTSSIAILENKKSDNWDLKLTNPRHIEGASDTFIKMPVKNKHISSSGDYERYYEKEGKRYSHIIDATLGKPIDNGIIAATVICQSANLADMLSTAICVMGRDNAIKFMKSNYCAENDIQVILTYIENDQMKIFTSVKGEITLQDNRYVIEKI